MNVDVYRSTRKADLYLYVAEDQAFDALPAELLRQFGEAVHALALELDEHTTLARSDAVKVLRALRADGYYLQLPPVIERI